MISFYLRKKQNLQEQPQYKAKIQNKKTKKNKKHVKLEKGHSIRPAHQENIHFNHALKKFRKGKNNTNLGLKKGFIVEENYKNLNNTCFFT